MTWVRFVQVDAFADRPFAGNPAAVMFLEFWPEDALLQAVASENNLAETAFLVPAAGDAEFELRWFTPAVEVALCGHATLAAGHVLLGGDPARTAVRFAARRAGVLTVARDGSGYALDLPAWSPAPRLLPEIAVAMGGRPIETLWRDGGYALIVYEDAAAIRALAPDYRALAAMGTTLFIATAPGDRSDVISRAFAPGAGIDEDPVTGSAHAVLAPYWFARLGRETLTAEQASRRGGFLRCRAAGDRVVLGGECVTVIEGQFHLAD